MIVDLYLEALLRAAEKVAREGRCRTVEHCIEEVLKEARYELDKMLRKLAERNVRT